MPVAEFGTYLFFSLLVGHVIFEFVPESKKPTISIPKSVFLLCTLGIIIFTFMPVLNLILFFNNGGLLSSIATVLIDFQIGRAWIFISLFSIFLWMTLYLEGSKYLKVFWLLLMAVAVGYASHVATFSVIVGLFSHTTHYLMANIWVGVLLLAAWFSKDQNNWTQFLQWFTPLAVICLLNIFASGFVIMSTIEKPNEYVNGWATPYGRVLVLKHISIIPVITFALINGILAKKTLSSEKFNPRLWLKAESLLLLIVFYSTGVLGTLPPPEDVVKRAQSAVTLTWVDWLLARNLLVPLQIEFVPTLLSLLVIIVALLFLVMIVVSFKMMSPSFAIIFGGCFIVTMYIGLMFSVSLTTLSSPNEDESSNPPLQALGANENGINLAEKSS
jgi:copper resistance protein D